MPEPTTQSNTSNVRRFAVWGIALLVVALVAWKLHASHFDWAAFWQACRSADLRLVALAILIIYTNAIVRALRWSIFLKPALPREQRPPWTSLIGSQFIGFTALAILGRIGELIRPYLVSKRTGLPFSSQVAVVAIERIFDLAAFGILFSGNLLLSPELMTLPYHQRFHLFGYAIGGATLFLCAFVFTVRVAGEPVARVLGTVVGKFSQSAGKRVAAAILQFRGGLNTIGSATDFFLILALSLLMWISIAFAYIFTMRAFPPPIHYLGIHQSLFLMGFSVIGGLVQLPGVGGGAQIVTAGALHTIFGIPLELATSVGIILPIVTTFSVILPGLIYARVEGVSLRNLARTSEDAAATK